MKRLIPFLIILFLTGCATLDDQRFTANIKADGPWTGTFNGAEIRGSGDQRITLGMDQPQCFTIKNESSSALTARIEMGRYARSNWQTIEVDEIGVVCSDVPAELSIH